jgi:hypothetical protein
MEIVKKMSLEFLFDVRNQLNGYAQAMIRRHPVDNLFFVTCCRNAADSRSTSFLCTLRHGFTRYQLTMQADITNP